MNAETESAALAAVDLAATADVGKSLHTSAVELVSLPTPTEIGKLTEDAFHAAELASARIRALGALAEQMASFIQRRCNTTADLFLKTATLTNDMIKEFSGVMQTIGGSVNTAAEKLEDAVSKAQTPVAQSVPDQFGKKPAQKTANGQ